MKRYIKCAALAAISLIALGASTECRAWNRMGHESAVLLAQAHLTPEVRNRVETILGSSMKSNAGWLDDFASNKEVGGYTLKWHSLHLAADFTPNAADDNDALVQVERAAEVLRHRAEHPDSLVAASLRTLLCLVPEMHSIPHVRIANIPLSNKKFNVQLSNGFTGKKAAINKMTWEKFWDKVVIFNTHGAFSPEMYADDMEICYGGDAAAFAAGTPRDWACEMGRECAVLYKWAQADYLMAREFRNRQEPIAYKCLARSGYRLAALLNECLK